jgi:hypothetical protein
MTRKTLVLFLGFILLLAIIYISDYLLINDQLFFNSLSESLSSSQIRRLLNQRQNFKWITYFILPIFYLVKYLFVTFCLSIGIFFVTDKFEFYRIFGLAVKAEFIFLIPVIIKLFWFLFIKTNYSLSDFQYFSPLSALNMFQPNELEPWLLYPLQVLNVFEIFYWIILAYLLSKEIPELDLNQAFTVVMSGYGTGLVIWVALVMFFTLSYT